MLGALIQAESFPITGWLSSEKAGARNEMKIALLAKNNDAMVMAYDGDGHYSLRFKLHYDVVERTQIEGFIARIPTLNIEGQGTTQKEAVESLRGVTKETLSFYLSKHGPGEFLTWTKQEGFEGLDLSMKELFFGILIAMPMVIVKGWLSHAGRGLGQAFEPVTLDLQASPA